MKQEALKLALNFVEVITAIKEALAQPEQEPVAWRTFDGEGGYDYRSYEDNESYADDWDKRNPNHKGWVEPLYTHPPQPEQEPVVCNCNQGQVCHICDPITPPQRTEQELVACERCKQLEEQAYDLLGQLKVANLKLSVRSQRTWVGLSDEDIGDEYVRFEIQGGFNRFEYAVKAIEAKIKDKNS